MKHLLRSAAILFLATPSLGGADEPLRLRYDRPAARWTEALPVGNGRLGSGFARCYPSCHVTRERNGKPTSRGVTEAGHEKLISQELRADPALGDCGFCRITAS